MDIMTVPQLKRAIREARLILTQPRFGLNESWVKLAKGEALALVSVLDADMTPHDLEMSTGRFGNVEGDTLYLG
jgi:hypothetical protein